MGGQGSVKASGRRQAYSRRGALCQRIRRDPALGCHLYCARHRLHLRPPSHACQLARPPARPPALRPSAWRQQHVLPQQRRDDAAEDRANPAHDVPVHCPATSAGPKARAGFIAAPVSGPPTMMSNSSTRPTPNPPTLGASGVDAGAEHGRDQEEGQNGLDRDRLAEVMLRRWLGAPQRHGPHDTEAG